jgi:hypothetical protein
LQFLENVGVNTLNEVVELKTDTKIQLNVMENKLETIVDTLNKPKNKKVKPLPLRDGIIDTIFAEIMRTHKLKRI